MNIRERLQITLDGGLDQWPIASIEWEYREAIKALDAAQARETELLADNERLREVMQTLIDEHEECSDSDGWTAMMCSIEAHQVADEALATPAQSLARIRNQMREECIAVLEAGRFLHDDAPAARLTREAAKAIRATKEPE